MHKKFLVPSLCRSTAVGLAATLALMGCASSLVVDGLPVGEQKWSDSQRDVRRRASFDMGCDAAALELTLLEVHEWARPPNPTQVGVTGCGRRGVYVRTSSGWVLNTDQRDSGAEPGTPPPRS